MSRIGLINEGECDTTIDDLKAYFVNEYNKNYPNDENSPNYPRVPGRLPHYQNPLLGDPGWGEIGRWHKVKTNAVETLLDQMIAQYLMNRDWYPTVRCREALWNMYRRLEWWVEQNVGRGDSDYSQAMSFLRDCIYKILDPGEEAVLIANYKFVGSMLPEFVYEGDWDISNYGYLKGVSDGGVDTTNISTIVNYPNPGILTFNYAPNEFVEELVLYMDGVEIWSANEKDFRDDGYTFRDVTVPVTGGEHVFRWEIDNGEVRFDEFDFVEHKPTRPFDDTLPKCPLPYEHKYRTDYANNFSGIPYERAIFSTATSKGISEPLDLIRYVSSKENIEWEIFKGIEGNADGTNENILKLPLERLPETLSSKFTYNMRMKKRGFVTFKYLMESGGGSRVSLYINNRKSTYDLEDTSEWKEVKVNVSQAQTYKFDIMIHKLFSSDIGLNAVYLKDIEVVEVTGYTDAPMPGDYSYEGQRLGDKWLIYSHRNALGSYYRGFPDGVEDMTREIEFEFYSECDGVFGFEHLLGTEDPDRFFVEGTVFTEGFKLNEQISHWDGILNGVGVPSVYVKPSYGEWHNTIEGKPDENRNFVYWTKDSTNINYNVTLDKVWTRGERDLSGYVDIGVLCPPKYLIEERYIKSSNVGEWIVGHGWSEGGGFSLKSTEDYGEASYRSDSPQGSYMDISINEKLAFGEKLNIHYGGMNVYSGYAGFDSGELRLAIDRESTLNFSIIKPEPPEPVYGVSFVGAIDFEGAVMTDGRGRSLRTYTSGGEVSGESFTTDKGFTMEVDIKAGEEVFLRLPNSLIPYIDQDKIDQEVGEIIDQEELGEFKEVFYADYNEVIGGSSPSLSSGGRTVFDPNEWLLVGVSTYLDMGNAQDDGIIATQNLWSGDSFSIELDSPLKEDAVHVLSFEYGARYSGGVDVVALPSNKILITLTKNNITLKGNTVTNISVPSGTESIVFTYE